MNLGGEGGGRNNYMNLGGWEENYMNVGDAPRIEAEGEGVGLTPLFLFSLLSRLSPSGEGHVPLGLSKD